MGVSGLTIGLLQVSYCHNFGVSRPTHGLAALAAATAAVAAGSTANLFQDSVKLLTTALEHLSEIKLLIDEITLVVRFEELPV